MRERWFRTGLANGLVFLAATMAAPAAAQQHVVWRDLTLFESIPGAPRPVRYTLEVVPARLTFVVDSTRWVDGRREVFGERSRLVVDPVGALIDFMPPPPPPRPQPELLRRAQIGALGHGTVGVYFREVENAAVYRVLPQAPSIGQRWEEPFAWSRDSLGACGSTR